jgi:hypothetical protein
LNRHACEELSSLNRSSILGGLSSFSAIIRPRSAIRPRSTHHLKPACVSFSPNPPAKTAVRPSRPTLDRPQRLCASVPLHLTHPLPLLSQASPVSSCLTCHSYPPAPYALGPHLRVRCHVRLWRLVVIERASPPLHSSQFVQRLSNPVFQRLECLASLSISELCLRDSKITPDFALTRPPL